MTKMINIKTRERDDQVEKEERGRSGSSDRYKKEIPFGVKTHPAFRDWIKDATPFECPTVGRRV